MYSNFRNKNDKRARKVCVYVQAICRRNVIDLNTHTDSIRRRTSILFSGIPAVLVTGGSGPTTKHHLTACTTTIPSGYIRILFCYDSHHRQTLVFFDDSKNALSNVNVGSSWTKYQRYMWNRIPMDRRCSRAFALSHCSCYCGWMWKFW